MRHEGTNERTDAMSFMAELAEQRWDDHRLYHHSRINQSLHLLSALSFLTAYVCLLVNPGVSALIGWVVAMCSRQVGHFFFEPKDYDDVNGLSHEHKEEIKVGYNLRRKVVLMSVWAASPFVLWAWPTLGGLFEAHASWDGYVNHLSMLWLALGGAGLLFRTVQLFFVRSTQTGLVWCTKILTDPFHDLQLYHRSPLYLLRGELIDPMGHVRAGVVEDELEDAGEETELEAAG
jgi:hypothetical protein